MPDNRYPINHHILAEDFREQAAGRKEYSQDDAKWLHDSLHKMCTAYDDVMEYVEGTNVSTHLSEWCVARLKDSRESAEVDEDVSDAVIEREAQRLEIEIHKVASSFVDNEFNEEE
jgi:hypothetical protein